MLDLHGGHFAVIVVIEVTVNALLVATIGEIELRAERDTQPQGSLAHLQHQGAPRFSCSEALATSFCEIGCSEIKRMPWLARFSANSSASRIASSGFTSNVEQM